MVSLSLLLVAACGGTLRNEAPEPLATQPVPPGFDRFQSSVIHVSVRASGGLTPDGEIAVSDVHEEMALLLHDRGGRISVGSVSSAEEHGALAHALQFLRLPAQVVDAALMGDSLVCALRDDAKILCAGLREKSKSEIAVDPTSTRLLSLGDDVLCAMRRAGDFACYGRSGSEWREQKGTSAELDAKGSAIDVVPDAPCFVTRAHELVCVAHSFTELGSPEIVASDVARASVNGATGDLAGGCAVKTDGRVICWGGFNELGTSGDGVRGPHEGPWRVKDVAGAVDVARGTSHACALAGGHVSCWGSADGSAYGDAALASATHFRVCNEGESPGGGDCVTKPPFGAAHQALHLTPVRVPELDGVVSIAVGGDMTCGLRTDGMVLCVGGGHAGSWTLRMR